MKKIFIAVGMMVMSGGVYAADFSDLAVKGADLKAQAEAVSGAVQGIPKGYVQANAPQAGAPGMPVEWIAIEGGTFTMGNDDLGSDFSDAKPIHEVVIKTFEMSKTDVTVEQYAECVIKGQCNLPYPGEYCNWGQPDRQKHPVNCVNWDQATQYGRFKGARLPTESEWEYTATSGGRNQKYPWGNDEPTCDRAVMNGNGAYGCGNNGTMPVCSKPAGNSAQGLCDMSGNVWQWVQDRYQDSYKNAPADGSAFEGPSSVRGLRGGAFYRLDAKVLRADYRHFVFPAYWGYGVGFRLARSR